MRHWRVHGKQYNKNGRDLYRINTFAIWMAARGLFESKVTKMIYISILNNNVIYHLSVKFWFDGDVPPAHVLYRQSTVFSLTHSPLGWFTSFKTTIFRLLNGWRIFGYTGCLAPFKKPIDEQKIIGDDVTAVNDWTIDVCYTTMS